MNLKLLIIPCFVRFSYKCRNESAYLVSNYALSNYVNSFLKKIRFHRAQGCEFAGTRSTGHQCHGLLRKTGALFRRGGIASDKS